MPGKKAERINDFPQGLSEYHSDIKAWHRHANPLALLVLGALMLLALSGALGGQPHPTRQIDAPAATMTFQLPERIRNGEFFEMRMEVLTKQPFDNLTVAISSGYFHDLTINTMIPAPSEEKSEAGSFVFSYGEIESGTEMTIKIDGQINPPLFRGNDGEIELRDGDTVIATLPVELKVMP
jgi:hypothetical protein